METACPSLGVGTGTLPKWLGQRHVSPLPPPAAPLHMYLPHTEGPGFHPASTHPAGPGPGPSEEWVGIMVTMPQIWPLPPEKKHPLLWRSRA